MSKQMPHSDTSQDQPTDLLAELLRRRYFLKDSHGRAMENADQMFERVARAIAHPLPAVRPC